MLGRPARDERTLRDNREGRSGEIEKDLRLPAAILAPACLSRLFGFSPSTHAWQFGVFEYLRLDGTLNSAGLCNRTTSPREFSQTPRPLEPFPRYLCLKTEDEHFPIYGRELSEKCWGGPQGTNEHSGTTGGEDLERKRKTYADPLPFWLQRVFLDSSAFRVAPSWAHVSVRNPQKV